MHENVLSYRIIECAIEVHRALGGPGLLESVYEEALTYELQSRDYIVERQIEVPIEYKGIQLATPLRLDLRVNRKVLIECKAVVSYNAIYEAQLLTYLRLTNLRLGLVINFGEKYVREGVHRVVNRLD